MERPHGPDLRAFVIPVLIAAVGLGRDRVGPAPEWGWTDNSCLYAASSFLSSCLSFPFYYSFILGRSHSFLGAGSSIQREATSTHIRELGSPGVSGPDLEAARPGAEVES